ncbi:hypothetical protein Btru_035621 [Bulinus truncatus]|nr:hypothetical protein Btru_035621 [Bulinus truncatus]
MIVNERIDFEQIEKIELIARCTDSGQPQLSNTTRVIVNVININDNIPTFRQQVYRKNILEGTYSGPLNLTVSASDGDKEDFGVVRYKMQDPREYDLTVLGVYVTIEDINDHCPVFNKLYYQGKVPESAGPNTNIIDLIITDADEGANAEIILDIKQGSFNPASGMSLFAVSNNGHIVVSNSLRAKAGVYNFNVTASDRSLTSPCTTEVPVEIEIQVSLNDAPVWLKPPNRDFVIYVLESQYDGMLVYGAKAVDNNTGANGIVDYYFVANRNYLVSNTSEFRINQITGVIRAEIVYDREQRDRYFLTLMAKDRGTPAASSETTLTVIILDVDDNRPVFATKNGVVIPLILPDSSNEITENVVIPNGGLKLGACNASDADSDTANNRIFYKLLSDQPSITDYIRVNNITCEIFLIKKPDFETSPELRFDIYAYNDNNNDRVIRNKRQVDPSILPVIIRIKDSNDNAPKFSQYPYYECVAADAPYRQNILEVSATDTDTASSVSYAISNKDAFVIDSTLGIISNIISFQYTPNVPPSYTFNVNATDGVNTNTTNVTIFVVSPSNLIYMKINRPLYDVEPFKQQIAQSIQKSDTANIKFACIIDMKTHVEDDGMLNSQATDISVAAVSASTGQLYSSPDLVSLIEKERNQKNSVYNAVYVTNVKEYQKKDEFSLSEDAVLAILIITILLIFLAIILFIIACFVLDGSKKKKTKTYHSKSTVLAPQPLEPSSNPVFRSPHEEEDVYTLPKKKPIHSEQYGLEVESPALAEPSYIPPPEPFRGYLNTEPEPVIETELESLHEYVPELPFQPYEPEYEDKIVTVVDDDDDNELPAPFVEGEIETEIRNSPTSSSVSSPASSRKSGSHHSD